MKKILVIGSEERVEEFQELTLQNASVSYIDDLGGNVNPEEYEVIFDLNLDDNPENLENYAGLEETIVIGCAVKGSLAEMGSMLSEDLECTLFGMNALPSFINRPRVEMSLYDAADRPDLMELMDELGLEYEIVDDRVGMVTPRILCLIINEACFVLGEGTADIPAVNRAMRLGTNYPQGPFEWADAIGVDNVFETLEALKDATGEEKYKIAPTPRKFYLKGFSFEEE